MNSLDYHHQLIRDGGAIIGSGAFAQVYSHPTDPTRAIKVSRGREIDGWLSYAIWVREQTDTQHLPVIHSIQRYNEGECDDFYVAQMDRCHTTLYERICAAREECMPEADRLRSAGYIMKDAMDRPSPNGEVQIFSDLGFPATVLSTIDRIRDAFTGVAALRDLHSSNVMFSFDDELIITDPLSDSL